MNDKKLIGYACCYTPVQLIQAAGYVPYRILPMGNSPDQAGRILHDNLCPHVKKILDRAMGDGLPDMDGVIFMNSCDAMRRLFDAWKRTRPGDRIHLTDLPAAADKTSIEFFKDELAKTRDVLAGWSGKKIDDEDIYESINKYNELAGLMFSAGAIAGKGLAGFGGSELQALYNKAMTEPLPDAIASVKQYIKSNEGAESLSDKTPVFIFGNVLPDPEVFELIESCGARTAANDLCTGSRMFTEIENSNKEDPLRNLAAGLLGKPPCSRTMDTERVNWIGEHIISSAKKTGTKGIIGHTMKFCDPYILRLPMIREMAQKEGIPMLLLEGDCTMRSMGQQRTRIEAFIEMLR